MRTIPLALWRIKTNNSPDVLVLAETAADALTAHESRPLKPKDGYSEFVTSVEWVADDVLTTEPDPCRG